jgi:hypothetical protein
MLTIADAARAAAELTTGEAVPSLKLALWASILSPQKPISHNGEQARVLWAYVEHGLPTRDPRELRAHISAHAKGMVYENHARAILLIEQMSRAGELAGLEVMPRTIREWQAWRKRVAMLPGLSWKTASFAALLLWPFESPFVPVDSHVCKRLGHYAVYQTGVLSSKSKRGYRLYRSIERLVYAEWRESGKPCPIGVWHWFKWEQHRQRVGESRGKGCESHALMSARGY